MAEAVLTSLGVALFEAFSSVILSEIRGRLHQRRVEGEQRTAFSAAMQAAREQTLRKFENSDEAIEVLDLMDGTDQTNAKEFAQEVWKLWKLSESPNVSSLVKEYWRTLGFIARLKQKENTPSDEFISQVVTAFWENLYKTVLDQQAFAELRSLEQLRAQWRIAEASERTASATEEIAEVLKDGIPSTLQNAAPISPAPFIVENRLEDFVQRPKEYEELLGLLLDEDCQRPVAITAALRGAGGYGKTTLANELCHDERIRKAFKDGILWVTLGEM